jgi:hypothetical protein
MSHTIALPSLLSLRPVILIGAAFLLQACAAPQAVDIADNWKPVNTLAANPQQIPLKEEVELPKFQMLPTDATLRHIEPPRLSWRPVGLSQATTMED